MFFCVCPHVHQHTILQVCACGAERILTDLTLHQEVSEYAVSYFVTYARIIEIIDKLYDRHYNNIMIISSKYVRLT